MESSLSPQEALLFRLLGEVFGPDQIAINCRASLICGQSYPQEILEAYPEIERYAKTTRCLFTVLNPTDNPCLVIEMSQDSKNVVDMDFLERQNLLQPLFSAKKILYITVSEEELRLATQAASRRTICDILSEKIEDSHS